jgi:hypothetical protein
MPRATGSSRPLGRRPPGECGSTQGVLHFQGLSVDGIELPVPVVVSDDPPHGLVPGAAREIPDESIQTQSPGLSQVTPRGARQRKLHGNDVPLRSIGDDLDHLYDVAAVDTGSTKLPVRVPIGTSCQVDESLASRVQAGMSEDDRSQLIERSCRSDRVLVRDRRLPHRLVDERDRVRGSSEVEPLQCRRPQVSARHVSALFQPHCSLPMTCRALYGTPMTQSGRLSPRCLGPQVPDPNPARTSPSAGSPAPPEP